MIKKRRRREEVRKWGKREWERQGAECEGGRGSGQLEGQRWGGGAEAVAPGAPRPQPLPACLPVPGPGGVLASTGGGGRAAVGLFMSQSLLSPSADCRSVLMIQNCIYIYIFLLDLNLWAKTCGHNDKDLPLNVVLSVIADTKLTRRFTRRVEAGVGGTSQGAPGSAAAVTPDDPDRKPALGSLLCLEWQRPPWVTPTDPSAGTLVADGCERVQENRGSRNPLKGTPWKWYSVFAFSEV